jgi:hypothetical protein
MATQTILGSKKTILGRIIIETEQLLTLIQENLTISRDKTQKRN